MESLTVFSFSILQKFLNTDQKTSDYLLEMKKKEN